MSYFYRPAPMTFSIGFVLWGAIGGVVYLGHEFLSWLQLSTETVVEHFLLIAIVAFVTAVGSVLALIFYLVLSDWSAKGCGK